MLASLWDTFGRHSKTFVVLAGVVVILSSVYFYINKEKFFYNRYYLTGYLIVLFGIVVSLIRIFFSMRSWGLILLSSILYISGFMVVLYGGKKRREIDKTQKRLQEQ